MSFNRDGAVQHLKMAQDILSDLGKPVPCHVDAIKQHLRTTLEFVDRWSVSEGVRAQFGTPLDEAQR